MMSINDSSTCLFSKSSEISSVDRISNQSGIEFSEFSDAFCGEPLLTQHLLIDFTPDDVIDNDVVQKKICEFWNCVNNAPHIQKLMVIPEKKSFASSLSPTDTTELLNLARQETHVGKTAFSMLGFVKDEGLIDRVFEAKLPYSMCQLGSRESQTKEIDPTQQDTNTQQDSHLKIFTPSSRLNTDEKPQKILNLTKTMCKIMEDWDSKHPKSMEPPGHSPLQHCILQR